jgi:hypothetical protein
VLDAASIKDLRNEIVGVGLQELHKNEWLHRGVATDTHEDRCSIYTEDIIKDQKIIDVSTSFTSHALLNSLLGNIQHVQYVQGRSDSLRHVSHSAGSKSTLQF